MRIGKVLSDFFEYQLKLSPDLESLHVSTLKRNDNMADGRDKNSHKYDYGKAGKKDFSVSKKPYGGSIDEQLDLDDRSQGSD